MTLHGAFTFDNSYARYAQVATESVLVNGDLGSDTTFWLLVDQDVDSSARAELADPILPRAGVEILEAGAAHQNLPLSNRAEWDWVRSFGNARGAARTRVAPARGRRDREYPCGRDGAVRSHPSRQGSHPVDTIGLGSRYVDATTDRIC